MSERHDPRHRAPPRSPWTLLAAALLGAGLAAAAMLPFLGAPTSASPPPVPGPPSAIATAPPSTPGVVSFGEPLTGPDAVQVTALPPKKIKGGVRVSVALLNVGSAAATVSTGAVGPHDPTFRERPVPMSMETTSVRLVPGEGHVYACDITLPDMDSGRLAFGLGPGMVTGSAAGD